MRRVQPSQLKKQALNELLEGVAGKDDEGLLSQVIKLSVERTIQELLEAEQRSYLGRDHYQRGGSSAELHRNGYESARLKTAEGVLEVSKPQVRGGAEPYRSELWERLSSTSGQLRQLIVEMYALGLSQRDIEQALERSLGGFVVSRSTVSMISEDLATEYEQFKTRDLSGFDVAYLFLDVIYEPLRRHGSRSGVLCCWAYLTNGSRVLLDVTTAQSESYEAALAFLRGMVARGLRVPLTVTTDGSPGLIKAVEQVWPLSHRIRCWFHKMQNLQAKVPERAWPEFKSWVIDVRDAPTVSEAETRLETLLKRYRHELPEACRCLMEDTTASLNHLQVLPRHRTYVRTTNLVERAFVEERRRTKVIPHLTDEKSLLKLVYGVLARVSDRWAHPAFSAAEQSWIVQTRNRRLRQQHQPEPTSKRKKRRSPTRAA